MSSAPDGRRASLRWAQVLFQAKRKMDPWCTPSILSGWGTGVRMVMLDLDELVALPTPRNIGQLLVEGECLHQQGSIRVPRFDFSCPDCNKPLVEEWQQFAPYSAFYRRITERSEEPHPVPVSKSLVHPDMNCCSIHCVHTETHEHACHIVVVKLSLRLL